MRLTRWAVSLPCPWPRGLGCLGDLFRGLARFRLWAPNRFVNRSTRPSVSISFWRPVKNGWHMLQISRCSSVFVDFVLNVFPHAHRTSTSWYFG